LRSLRARLARPDVAFGHTFRPPPYGGSNQFLLALRREFERRGLRVGEQLVAPVTRAALLNAYVFDIAYFRNARRKNPSLRVVHRVDGPLAAYRGFDDGTDELIAALNDELADATIFQSNYSLSAHEERGLTLREPVVIHNAVDSAIFHPPAARPSLAGRRLRLVATSWSDNPNKGAATYAQLGQHLDRDRFELTFVGNASVPLPGVRHVAALPSGALAEELRAHDMFVLASRNEPCSNALLEALACGLPAVYRDSGGNAELAGAAGVPFVDDDELPATIEDASARIDALRAAIASPSIERTADDYLAALGIDE
jgi:glycosyltransferase involved in cell wall biosynthesis